MDEVEGTRGGRWMRGKAEEVIGGQVGKFEKVKVKGHGGRIDDQWKKARVQDRR